MLKNLDGKDITTDYFSTIFTDKRVKFEILSEEDEEIDIDSIEEVKHKYIYNLPPNVEEVDDRVTMNEEKINEVIRAMKQINKQMKEK